jgi:hypothetical protein
LLSLPAVRLLLTTLANYVASVIGTRAVSLYKNACFKSQEFA